MKLEASAPVGASDLWKSRNPQLYEAIRINTFRAVKVLMWLRQNTNWIVKTRKRDSGPQF